MSDIRCVLLPENRFAFYRLGEIKFLEWSTQYLDRTSIQIFKDEDEFRKYVSTPEEFLELYTREKALKNMGF